jgi:hypothetical protein
MIRRHTASAPAAEAEYGMLGCWIAYQGQMVSSVKAIVLSYIVTMWQVSWEYEVVCGAEDIQIRFRPQFRRMKITIFLCENV